MTEITDAGKIKGVKASCQAKKWNKNM